MNNTNVSQTQTPGVNGPIVQINVSLMLKIIFHLVSVTLLGKINAKQQEQVFTLGLGMGSFGTSFLCDKN